MINTEISTSKGSNEELDLPQLMEKIRDRAEDRRAHSLIDTAAILSRVLKADFATESSPNLLPLILPDLALQPPFVQRDQYHARDFLDYDDEAFVRNAYLGILKREPDDAGSRQYLGALRQGKLSKIDILSRLRFSPEGESAGVALNGLGPGSLRRLYRVPVFGYLLEMAASIVTLPSSMASHRKLEAHVGAQNQKLLEYINQTSLRLIWHIDEIARGHSNKVIEILEGQRKLAELNLQQNKALFREQRELTEDLNRLKKEISNSFAATQGELKNQAFTDEVHLEKLQELQELVTNQVQQKLQLTRMELVLQQRRVTILLEEMRGGQPNTAKDPRPVESVTDQNSHLLDSLYSALEDQFRGSREDIKDAFKIYLPILREANISSEILDVGCGRGEWLQVLRDAGMTARGIDINRLAIRECEELKLEASEADAITHLKSLPDQSLRCITAFHIAEHLPLKTLVSLIDECLRTLKSGGLFILETPNPQNVIVGSCNFYFDPTHRHPLPRATLQCILEARGFGRLETLELHPMLAERLKGQDELTRRFNEHFYGPMDYAIVARRL